MILNSLCLYCLLLDKQFLQWKKVVFCFFVFFFLILLFYKRKVIWHVLFVIFDEWDKTEMFGWRGFLASRFRHCGHSVHHGMITRKALVRGKLCLMASIKDWIRYNCLNLCSLHLFWRKIYFKKHFFCVF